MISLKYKLIAFLLAGVLILGYLYLLIKATDRISELRAENKQLQTQLQNCKDTNQQLTNQIQVQQEQYIKARKEIEEASKKPPRRVFIRQVIKKPIYITNTECQQMADLIKQAEVQLK
jgi:Tfp pilus assembly protein PilO